MERGVQSLPVAWTLVGDRAGDEALRGSEHGVECTERLLCRVGDRAHDVRAGVLDGARGMPDGVQEARWRRRLLRGERGAGRRRWRCCVERVRGRLVGRRLLPNDRPRRERLRRRHRCCVEGIDLGGLRRTRDRRRDGAHELAPATATALVFGIRPRLQTGLVVERDRLLGVGHRIGPIALTVRLRVDLPETHARSLRSRGSGVAARLSERDVRHCVRRVRITARRNPQLP